MKRLALTLTLSALASLAMVASASADLEFATVHGPGAGQTQEPRGIAVDRSNGDVYVADTGNRRVDVFEADGDFVRAFGWGVADGTTNALQVCTTTCFKGIAGSGAGQLSGPEHIAVDNDPSSPSHHAVYVYDPSNSRVQKFSPAGAFLLGFGSPGFGSGQFSNKELKLALGPGGTVHVADGNITGFVGGQEVFENRVQKFDASGTLIDSFPLVDANRRLSALAVDVSGDIYVGTQQATVRKYDPSGVLLNAFPVSNIRAFDTDVAGNLFVSTSSAGDSRVTQYDPVGTPLRVIYGDAERLLVSLALYSNATGDIFGLGNLIGSGAQIPIAHIPFPPPGPVVLSFAGTTTATAISNTKATVNAKVNPEGKATTFRVEYVDEETYDDEGFTGALKTPELAVGSDFELHKASTEIGCPNPATEVGEPGNKCLKPETTYHYRVVATNVDGTSTGPEGEPFTTKPPLEITAAFATDVVTSSAVLHGEVNPLGIPATGYFQYVSEATCEEDLKAFGPGHCFDHATDIPAPAGPIDFGSGEAPTARAVQLTELDPATTYRYRLIATNAFTTQTSSEQEIHTYALPSPPKTDCPNQAFRTAASAALSDCRAYELVSPTEKAGGDIAPLLDANLEQAARDGETITYSSYRAFGGPTSAPFTSQYLARRTGTGWQSESIAPPREGASFYGAVYRTANQFKLFSEDLCSAWLTTETEPLLAPQAIPGFPNVYRRQNCGSEAGFYEALTTAKAKEAEPQQLDPKPQAFSADGSVAVFTMEGKLTPDGVLCKPKNETCTRQLYSSQAGKLRLLCIYPDGSPSADGCAAGFIRAPRGTVGQRSDDAYHAVSDDGARVFWTDLGGTGSLYVRINSTQGQSKVEGGKCTEAGKACTLAVSTNAHFRAAAADGSVAIYTEGQQSGALHEFDVDVALTEDPGADTEIAGNALNVLGTSEDASQVYFISPEVLTEEPNSAGDKAVAGKPNLYLHEASEDGGTGGSAFIGTLSGSDGIASIQGSPEIRRSRVSPDGSHLAFVSAASLTDYDNRDAVSGKADSEVYLYDAEEEELRCVSCNPSGGRPAGADLNSGGEIENWTAAQIPAWTNGIHFSGVLSNDGGRLFFESVDPLVLRDTNGTIDIYEWTRAGGDGECEEIGADLFSPEAAGCIALISSGKSPQHSQLVDASTDGEDVFFMTQSSLLPQDTGLIDIYDARVEGGFPQPPPPPAACEGEACQGTPAAPNDPTPASSAFEGAGNLIEEAKPSCRKGTRAIRKAGKTRCVKRKAKSKRNDRTNSNRRTTR